MGVTWGLLSLNPYTCVGRKILLKVLIFPRPPFLNISNEVMSGANKVILSSFDNVKITKGFISLKTYYVYFMCVDVFACIV